MPGNGVRNMDRNDGSETAEAPDAVVERFAQRKPPFRFPTSTGVIVLDPECFIADVVNSVNDLIFDGFNGMEEFAAQTLDLKTEEARLDLKQGVDSIYNKVQDNANESLDRWESICRDRFFNFPAESQTISSSENTNANKNSSMAFCMEDIREEALDMELSSLQSQLIAEHREGEKMHRELTALNKQLALRRLLLTSEESFNSAVLEEAVRPASLLKETIVRARNFQDTEFHHQTGSQQLGDYLAEPTLEEKISSLQIPHDVQSGDMAVMNLLG